MSKEQNWPSGWTPRMRVETVTNEQISTDTRGSIPMISDAADVDVDTARSVVYKMVERGAVDVVEIDGVDWVSRQPDYSDTRWPE